jgi:hypothetical protein
MLHPFELGRLAAQVFVGEHRGGQGREEADGDDDQRAPRRAGRPEIRQFLSDLVGEGGQGGDSIVPGDG